MRNQFSMVFSLALPTMILLSCQSETQFGTGWDGFNLKGKPKKVTTTWQNYNGLDDKEVVEFKTNGQVKQIWMFESDTLVAEIKYFYGDSGKLDSTVEVNGNRMAVAYFEYFNSNLEKRIRRCEGRRTAELWKEKRLVSEEFEVPGIGLTHISYEYDKYGNQVNEKYLEVSVKNRENFYERNFVITELDKQMNWVSGKSVDVFNETSQTRKHYNRKIEY